MLNNILLVDMNSFFASVEQQANPFWRGKPLGVCASLHETSCLIAASKEAKSLGIKTGTVVYKAKKICPKIILVQAEPEKYREVHRRINRIFSDYTDRVEPYSIDESFLELANTKIHNPIVIGSEIKRRIREEVGEWLTCSVGISSNKFLAKLATDYQKPDGLTIISRDQLREVYKTKQLSDLWGIGRGWTKRLTRLGIGTPEELMNYPVANLMAMFGKPGYWLWQRVQGLEKDKISISVYPSPSGRGWREAPGEGELIYVTENLPSLSPAATSPPKGEKQAEEGQTQKSFGNSWVLNFRTTDKEKLKPVILRLAEKAARRMRQEKMQASSFYLFLRLVSGEHIGRSKKLVQPIETGLELFDQAALLVANWHISSPVMHIAVGFTALAPKAEQMTLFPQTKLFLTSILDSINDKYGEFTIRSGLLTRSSDFAPDSIAFGK